MIDFLKEILSEEDFEKALTLIEENYVEKTRLEQRETELQEQFDKSKLGFMLDSGLKNSGAKNMTAVKALLEMDNISFDENGELVGLDEQIKNLQKNQDFLFEKTMVKGLNPVEKTEETAVNPDDMGYEALCAYFKK
ncbi:MAG: phage scaffolding protein [Clostridia bacterium]